MSKRVIGNTGKYFPDSFRMSNIYSCCLSVSVLMDYSAGWFFGYIRAGYFSDIYHSFSSVGDFFQAENLTSYISLFLIG